MTLSTRCVSEKNIIFAYQFNCPEQVLPTVIPSSSGVWCHLRGVHLSSHRLVCYQSKCETSFVHVSSFISHGMEARCFLAPLKQSHCLHITPFCSSKTGLVESDAFNKSFPFFDPGSSSQTSAGVVHSSAFFFFFFFLNGRTSQAPLAWNLMIQQHIRTFHRGLETLTSHMEVVKQVVHKTGFLKEVAEGITLNFWRSIACLYQEKWSRFLHWCHGRNISPGMANVLQIAEFFFVSAGGVKLSVPVVKGYWAALNQFFFWLVCTWHPISLWAWCSLAPKGHVHTERSSHWSGTCLWFTGAFLIHLTSHLRCSWIST